VSHQPHTAMLDHRPLPGGRRSSLRLVTHAYRAGTYFVTLCTAGRADLFGAWEGEGCTLSPPGRIVESEWLRTGLLRSDVMLDDYVVMPDHFHALITLRAVEHGVGTAACAFSLGAIIAGFKASCTSAINEARGTPGAAVWQRNYFEHVVRDAADLDRIRRYIATNPVRHLERRGGQPAGHVERREGHP
jgi:putative transposase